MVARWQRGISLIEMMVAMLIASILIIGVTQIYIDNRRAYSFQQGQLENQENSRFVQLFLKDELSKTGYRRRPDIRLEDDPAFKAQSSFDCNFQKGQVITYTGGALCIRYQPRDTNERNCAGDVISDPSYDKPYTAGRINALIVEKISLSADGELLCNDQAVVDGVVDVMYEFGVSSRDTSRGVMSYTQSPGLNDVLVSVRYSVLSRSSGVRLRDVMDTNQALDTWKTLTGRSASAINSLKSSDKGQIYQISQRSVMLRNLMP